MNSKDIYGIRIVALISFCVLLVLIYFVIRFESNSSYYDIVPLATHSNSKQFAGSMVCMECHADIYKSHIETAHYKSSAIADLTTVKGLFDAPNNSFLLNDKLKYMMIEEEGLLFQEAYETETNSLRSRLLLDLVIGSGTKGQSYLSWDDDKLYQLQVSYFNPTTSWTNSPGMKAQYQPRVREVISSCLECHTTFAKSTSIYGMGNSYDKEKMIFGIDCERCHGPSLEHAAFQRKNPELVEARHIIAFDTLLRQQRLDACALCHSGIRTPKKPAFEFLTGDKLESYASHNQQLDSLENIDVHGNQYALLLGSKCFQETESMNCTTCHNPHKKQRGDMAYFNQKCTACHIEIKIPCDKVETLEHIAASNCVACHMPLQPSKSMFIENTKEGLKTPVQVRTHLIKKYVKQLGLNN